MRLSIERAEAARLKDRLSTWKADPRIFVREVFHATPDPWQDEHLAALPTCQRIATVSCASSGKTAVKAWEGWNLLLTRPHCQGAATAISAPNLKANLWKELAYWYGRSPILQAFFEVGTKAIRARGMEQTWFLEARNWDRDANPEQQGKVLAGLHARYVFFLIDEGGGIPTAVTRTAENVFADEYCEEAHVLMSGNPLEATGSLYEAAVERRPLWKVFEITGDPDDPKRAPRVSKQWAQEQIDSLGRDDYYVQVYVLGKFPSATTSGLISLAEFNAAFERWERRGELAQTPRTLGVDVARHGKNRTVVTPRAGDLVFKPKVAGIETRWQGHDTVFTTENVILIAQAWAGKNFEAKRLPIYVDDIGVGGGVTDQLKDRGYNAIGVNVDAAAKDKTRHANLKSEVGIGIQQRFRVGNIALHPELKRRTTLVAEGTALKVGFSAGRRTVEGKEEYQRRTGKSPDDFDSFLLSFADVSMKQRGTVRVGRGAAGGILQEEF